MVAISGPGLNETQTFQYPNNVMFVKLKPGGTYNWRVTVDGAVSDSWSFTAKDKIYPINDRSLDISIQDSTYLPQHIQKLLVSKNNYAFLKLEEKKVTVEFNSDAKSLLAKKGFDKVFGARPLERVIQKYIKKPLADKLLFGELLSGGHVKIKVKNKEFVFSIKPLNKKNSIKSKSRLKV